MKICDVCGKNDDEWAGGLALRYFIDNEEHFQCLKCTTKRIKELGNTYKERLGKHNNPKDREEIKAYGGSKDDD